MNLVVNAADAMPEGGTLVIHTGRENEDFTFLSVRDSGCGIPEEVRDRIFEPFFTTKPAERGTGLGLSVVHDIVARHAGYIDLVTEVGPRHHVQDHSARGPVAARCRCHDSEADADATPVSHAGYG